MIKRLRNRFIRIAMLSVTAVMMGVPGAVISGATAEVG